MLRRLALPLLAGLAAACGQMGPLVIPEKNPPAPGGAPAAAVAPAEPKPADDDSIQPETAPLQVP